MLKKPLVIWGLLLHAVGLAVAAPGAQLYVVNSLSEDISVIDTATDAVTARLPLGARGYRIAFSPRGDKAYVTSSSGVMLAEAKTKAGAGKEPSQLIIVDAARRRVEGQILMDISALANVHVHPSGRQAFVVTAAAPGSRNLQRGRVLFVDLIRRRVTLTVNVGLNPLDSVMTPDGRKLYTADWASRSISVVDLAAGRVQDTIPLGVNPVRVLAMRPDGKKVYAAQERLPTNPADALLTHNFDLANRTSQLAQQQQAPRVEENLLWEIDTTTGAVNKFPFDGLSPVYALAIAPDGRRLYAYGQVSSPAAHSQQAAPARARPVVPSAPQFAQAEVYDLIALDLNEKRIAQRFGNFGFLSTMTLSPDGSRLYLVGTPGDPALEAAVQRRNVERQRKMESQTSNLLAADASGIISDLSRLPKTVTILDARTGKRLKTLTIGSLPQGCGLRE